MGTNIQPRRRGHKNALYKHVIIEIVYLKCQVTSVVQFMLCMAKQKVLAHDEMERETGIHMMDRRESCLGSGSLYSPIMHDLAPFLLGC